MFYDACVGQHGPVPMNNKPKCNLVLVIKIKIDKFKTCNLPKIKTIHNNEHKLEHIMVHIYL